MAKAPDSERQRSTWPSLVLVASRRVERGSESVV